MKQIKDAADYLRSENIQTSLTESLISANLLSKGERVNNESSIADKPVASEPSNQTILISQNDDNDQEIDTQQVSFFLEKGTVSLSDSMTENIQNLHQPEASQTMKYVYNLRTFLHL